MASEVDICNLALSHIGDTAKVSNISPRPDNSVQAQLCARFYLIARNSLLEMVNWNFATKRVKLALVDNPTLDIAQMVDPTATTGTWQYAYAYPSDAVNVIALLPAQAVDDYEAKFGPGQADFYPPFPEGYVPVPGAAMYTPQRYVMETQPADGTQILLTNCADAFLIYTRTVTDTTKFSALFVLSLSYLLASMLAGPIIKGEEGSQKGVEMLKTFSAVKGSAAASDANQRKTDVQPSPSWIRGR